MAYQKFKIYYIQPNMPYCFYEYNLILKGKIKIFNMKIYIYIYTLRFHSFYDPRRKGVRYSKQVRLLNKCSLF